MKKINDASMKKTFILCVVLTGIFLLAYLVLEVVFGIPSFDGAMNLQVAISLLEEGKYKTTYDGGVIFDEKIQTRLPVLLPIVVLWKIFGVHISLAILVNALYILLLLFGVWSLCKEQGISRELSYSVILFIIITPYFHEFAFGVYGEIPTLALFLLSVLMLIKSEKTENKIKLYGFSGLFYSLSYLNKTVILIALPSFAFVFFIKLFWDKSVRLKEIVAWILSCMVPIALFEVFKFIQLGRNDYISGWKSELSSIGKQAGVTGGYEDTPNVLTKLWTHANIFCQSFSFKLGPIVLLGLLCLLFVYWLFRYFVKRDRGYSNIITLVMFSYFGWWLVITTTTKAWPRRILIGVILLEIVVCVDFYTIFKNKITNLMRGLIVFCTSGVFIFFTINKCEDIFNYEKIKKQEVEDMANIVRELEQDEGAEFFGFGWWQAPLLSLYSGVSFDNFYKQTGLTDNSYLLIDQYANTIKSDEVEELLTQYNTELIEKSGDNYLYKIAPLSENTVFSSAFNDVDETKIINRYDASDEYDYINGVNGYEQENDIRWAKLNVELLLNKDSSSSMLDIDITIPNVQNITVDKPILYVMVDNQVIKKIYFESEGNEIIHIPLPDDLQGEGIKDIRLFTNWKIISDTDSRFLSYRLSSISFSE